jgi:predicted nuclease of restriction endonuclease-like (RecB) superfamily
MANKKGRGTKTKISKKVTTQEYMQVLSNLKKEVQGVQVKAALSVNKELLSLYWLIGKTIIETQEKEGWGASIIENLADDLQKEFPGIAGFSRTNIFRMKAFFTAYEKVPQAVGQIENLPIFKIPWGHNVVLLEKVKDTLQRLWYAQKTIENGWSRSLLEMSIKSNLYSRQGKAVTNFTLRLPAPDSDLAQQTLKDPYIFDFLTLHEDYRERDIEQALIDNVQKLLLELGKGFSFVGRQYHLQISNKDFYIDLLFYHFRLRCFVVVELKTREFDARDVGQLNLYLSAIDEALRSPEDKPTIGLLLCRTKDNLLAEYALRRFEGPIGVASYETEITQRLPKELKSSLPTIEELEKELAKKEKLEE